MSKLLVLLQEHFQKYYDAVMPYLKAILVNANDKANCMLRAKAMECISLVGMAVGK
ncbi:putative armadillo-like helical, importin beta family [Helianthus annuus]|nr:putative armadillo-like helical, importin beta family [Helianthus annuus]